jgi:AmmeMemoRadiSam system protein B
MFYPGRADVLAGQVDELLSGVSDPAKRPKALIVPHAGYIYSGSTAAQGYATLISAGLHSLGRVKKASKNPPIQKVIILGPTHRVGVHALALPQADAFATPLGEVPLWAEGVLIAAGFPQVVESAQVHEREHSLEVQLPFLQRVLDTEFEIVPLAVGWVEPEQVAEVLDALWGGPETLIVISSDLSHYHTYEEARRIDGRTIAAILHLEGPLDHEQACGAPPINGLLEVARHRSLRPQLYANRNSGDTAGDHERVVGYASFGFYEN